MDIPGKGLICFEGQKLPEAAKHFELACFWKSLPDEIRIWTLDLHYAWARWREAPNDLVLRSCDELENRIYSSYSDLVSELSKRFSEDDATEICRDWISAINLMRSCAEKCEVCRWMISPLEGEVEHFLGVVSRVIRTQAKTLQAEKLHSGLPVDFAQYLEDIKAAPEEDQIAFIHRATDSYSNSRL